MATTIKAKTPMPAPDFETALGLRQELVDRVRRGDTTVTGEDFEQAESAVRFAQIHQEAAAEQAERAAQQAREAQQADLVAAIVALAGDETVAEADAKLREALDAFVAVCRARDERFYALSTEVMNLNDDVQGVKREAGGYSGTSLLADGKTIRQEQTIQRIRDAAGAAVARHYPRTQYDFGRS